MAVIVGVHGVGQQLKGESTLHAAWFPAMRDGLRRAGTDVDPAADFECAFYGDLFRRTGTKAMGDLAFTAADVEHPFELALLAAWAEAAGPDGPTKARTPLWVQHALHRVNNTRFFSRIHEYALIGDLKQVTAYMTDRKVRGAARERVARCIDRSTRVVIGHSLGSVVAYEVLCGREHTVDTFVTLGSPLGVANLIYDRLDPPPQPKPRWPGVRRWVNVADAHDIVALEKTLRPRFGDAVEDFAIDNGATAHDVEPYLTARETGAAIAAALAG